MTPAKLKRTWLQLTGWENENEIWIRADDIVAVVDTPAPRSPATKRGSGGYPFPGKPADERPEQQPYTRVETKHGAYRVRESIDDILGRVAEVLSMKAPGA